MDEAGWRWMHGLVIPVIISISRHFENPEIVRTAYLSIFRRIQGYSTKFSHVQAY